MSKIEVPNRRQFMGMTGAAGLSTLSATAVGVNLGLVDVVLAQGGPRAVTPFRFAIIACRAVVRPDRVGRNGPRRC